MKISLRHMVMLLLLAFLSTAAFGQRQIEVSFTDGTATQQLAMKDIGRMWIDGGTALAINIGEPATTRKFSMKDIRQVRFLAASTALESVETDGDEGPATVYDLQGRRVLSGVAPAEVSTLLRGMPRGIYIVKRKYRTHKIMNR